MWGTKSNLSVLSTSAVVAFVLIINCDPTDAYSNRLLRFARNDPKWRQPKMQNLLDMLTFKRSGGDSYAGDDGKYLNSIETSSILKLICVLFKY